MACSCRVVGCWKLGGKTPGYQASCLALSSVPSLVALGHEQFVAAELLTQLSWHAASTAHGTICKKRRAMSVYTPSLVSKFLLLAAFLLLCSELGQSVAICRLTGSVRPASEPAVSLRNRCHGQRQQQRCLAS